MHLVKPRPERNRYHYRNREGQPVGGPVGRLRPPLEHMVTRVFSVELGLMRLPTRGRAPVALARQVAMYLAHVGCGISLTEAGELFNRDRTTAAHACQVVEARREDPTFDRAMTLLERAVTVLSGPSKTTNRACVMTRPTVGQSLTFRGLRA
jgi:hypothetical protein